jgi:isocitrate dehydrogenase
VDRFNRIRRRLGFGYWSVAAYLKYKAKAAVKYVSDYEDAIVQELNEAQGKPVDIGGYYFPDTEKTTAVMRPSRTFNDVLADAQG